MFDGSKKHLYIKVNVDLTLCILDRLYCIVYLTILQVLHFAQIPSNTILRDSLHAPYPYHFPPTIIL